jgi:hypothetical protein
MDAGLQTRVPIAIFVPQENIPPGGPSSLNGSGSHHELILSGAGYGPPLLVRRCPRDCPARPLDRPQTRDTSVQRLVADIIQPTPDGKQREHDLVCLPLTNASWKARWEAMCVVGAQEDANAGSNKTYRFSLRMSSKMSAPSASSANEVEAERWRAEGGFRRGEVNATRSGATPRPGLTSR